MSSRELPPLEFVLTLRGHGGALREDSLSGGAPHHRYLNVTGRWASAGTFEVPLLSWSDFDSAKAGALEASLARERQVEATSVGGIGVFARYSEAHAGALLGYLPYDDAKARKLEAERQRLMGYAKVVLAGEIGGAVVSVVDVDSAMKKAMQDRRLAGVGNGGWFSAAQYLTGKRALEIFNRVIDGELACDPSITLEDLRKAIVLAKSLTTKS